MENTLGGIRVNKRKSLREEVYESLRRSIIHGKLKGGQRLIEETLAHQVGISRTPVREAMHKLEREGWLRRLPRGGFTVVNLTREDIEETFGIRCVLESYAARLAALNHKEEELRPLEEKIREFQRCLDAGQTDELSRINTEFHRLFYDLSRSPRLVKMIHDLRDQIYRFRRIILQVESMAKVSNNDHRKMMRAIRMRDANRVERLVKEHILRGRKIVLRELGHRPGEL